MSAENAVGVPDSGFLSVVDMIARTAARRPQSVAISAGGIELTYAQLWGRALDLAAELRDAGIGPDEPVGLCLPRSTALVVGALGIMAAGGGYVALDPAHPDERLRYMLRDSGARIVVAEPQVAERFDTPNAIAPPKTDVVGGPGTVAKPGPTDLAYVVYTSGSTGRPKGVMVEHAGLSNLVDWHRGAFALTPDDHTTLLAGPGFDASVWEIWPSLAAGSLLHVPPEQLKADPERLRDWMIRHGITVSFLPTPLAEAALDLYWPDRVALRYLLTGGDRLHRRPRADLPFTVVNNYGVSEATVVSTSGTVTPSGAGTRLPGIGSAIAGVDVLIVDEALQPVAPGAVGELIVRGVSVARGYIGDHRAGTTRFMPDPSDPDRRAYRTGDLVRVDAGGNLTFEGRLDDQIQIRGFRVEPGEVAAVLDGHPALRASAVFPDRDRDDAQLIAYVVTRPDCTVDDAELRAHLERHLPSHMVPRTYVRVVDLPINANGKVDRVALALLRIPSDEAVYTAPRTELERAIAAIVADLLGLQRVAVDENFFLLGGHSMLGAQLIMRISADFGAEMSLRSLFEHPTVAQMAEVVESLVLEEISEMTEESLLRATAHLGDVG